MTAGHIQNDQTGAVVAVQSRCPGEDLIHQFFPGFQKNGNFLTPLNGPFPPVNRLHGPQYIRAGNQLFRDKGF